VSVDETATTLGVTKDTIYAMIGDGRLTVSKLGRRTIVHTSSILKLLADTVVTTLPALPGEENVRAAARRGRAASATAPPPAKRAKART
jgi:excisionase family DNA binding protein